MTVQLKRNDTKDTISYTLTNLDDSVVNLTGATVKFVMGKNKTLITNAAATIVNAATGEVSYTLTDSDTLVAGTFNAEFEVTFSDGKIKSYPSNGYILVNIQANVDKDLSTYVADQIAYRVSDIQVLKNSIQAQLDEFAKGDSAPEVAQARVESDGTVNTTLKARLDKKEAKFAQDIQTLSTSVAQKAAQTDLDLANTDIAKKADKTYVDSVTQSIASGSPKGTYATLTALQTAFPTGNTNVYLVTADGKWYYWNGSTWTAGGTYQSTGIAESAITVNNLNPSLKDNLFVPVDLTGVTWTNQYLSPTTGAIGGTDTTRLLSTYIDLSDGAVITNSNPANYNMVIYKYTKQGGTYTYVSPDSGWITTNDYLLSGNYSVRIMLKKVAGGAIGTTEYSSIKITESLTQSNIKNITALQSEVTKFNSELRLNALNMTWTNQYINLSTGAVAGTDLTRLLSSSIEVFAGSTITNSNPATYNMVIYKYNKSDNSLIGDTGWVTSSGYTITGDYNIRIMLKKVAGGNIGLTEYSSISVDNSFPKTNKYEIDNIKANTDSILSKKNREHSLAFDQAAIISNWKVEKMAHTSCIYADTFANDGTIYGAYMGNNVTANEHPDNTDIQINFVKFNVADPNDIERWEAVKTGQAFSNFTQGSKPPYDPNMIISEYDIKLLFSAWDNSTAATGNGSFLGYITFDKTSKTFSNTFTTCQLKYTVNAVEKTVRFDTAGIQQCYTESGYTLSQNLTAQTYTTIMFTSQIKKHTDNYYYASLGMYGADFRGMVVRSIDGITWELYAIPNQAVGGNVMENCVEIVGEKLYYITRTGYFCVYDMTARVWLSYQALSGVVASKVNVFYFNSKLYIAYNKNVTLTTDWANVPRNTMILKEVDLNDTTKMTEVMEVQLEGGICYYHFAKYKGSLYMTFTNDRRKLNQYQVNSNISFIPIVL